MSVKRLVILAAIVTTVAGVAIAGVERYCTRPSYQCGIPSYNYQHGSRSQSETILSSSSVSLQEPDPTNQKVLKDLKHFQWKQATVRIDHCSISAPSLRLRDNGSWVLYLQANQNPEVENATAAATPEGRYTAHLKRNQFVVTLRCFGASTGEQTSADAAIGKPLLCVLGPTEFWVQRGQPLPVCKQGYAPCIKEYFELIDRVELEFFYR